MLDARGLAVVDERGRYRYGQLRDDASALASFLRDRGVDAASFVSVQLPNRYETVVVATAQTGPAPVVAGVQQN